MIKTLRISCLLAVGMLFAAMGANANTIAMNFTGPGGNNSGGVYVYPYNFTLDGSGNYALFCTTFTREITNGEQWVANTLTVDALNSSNVLSLEFPSAGVTGYLEASYLFVEEVNAYTAGNSDSEGLYNWAVWDLLSGLDVSAANLSSNDDATVQSYLSAAVALGNGGSLTPSQFANVVIYTPTDMSPSGPQEFLGYGTPIAVVPEPGTLALVGFGVLGLAAALRRKVIR
jgi:PEP-CTERM motif